VLEDLGAKLIAALPTDLENTIMQRIRGGDSDSGTAAAPTTTVDPTQTGTATPNYSGKTQQGLDQLIQNSNNAAGR
jgi:membrane protein required for colicin V production